MDIPTGSIEGLEDLLKRNSGLTRGADQPSGEKDAPRDPVDATTGNIVVKSVNIEVSPQNINKSLDSLASLSKTPDFNDAMEIVWFAFDPKKDKETFGCMSLLTTLFRATMDGNVKPPIDLPAMYQERYQAIGLEQQQNIGVEQRTVADTSPSPAKKHF